MPLRWCVSLRRYAMHRSALPYLLFLLTVLPVPTIAEGWVDASPPRVADQNRVTVASPRDSVPPPFEIPATIRLHQNYPNPFNSGTEIGFGLTFSQLGSQSFPQADVALRVYDILGRPVATIVDEPLTPGFYVRHFESRGLPSGVYFYRLQARGTTATRKMLLLK